MFDFPASPTIGQPVTMPDGTTRTWDGVKWVAGGYAPASYVPLAGGTMTGPLLLNADPTSPLQAADKRYVDATVAGQGGAYNFGRNYVHNSRIAIQQRGQGSWPGATGVRTYTADRWNQEWSGTYSSCSSLISAMTDADRAAIGDESARYCLQVSWNCGSVNAPLQGDVVEPLAPLYDQNGYIILQQFIEGIRRLAGKTVTVSWWMKVNSNYSPQMSVGIQQFGMGTGGTPSAPPTPVPATPFNYNGEGIWAKYSATMAIPSLSGLTLGTNGDDYTTLRFWLSAGSNYPEAGGIGLRISGSHTFWGIQLEEGATATPLQRIDPVLDLQMCQRFYYQGVPPLRGIATGGTSASRMAARHPVPMRAAPTLVISSPLPVFDGVTPTTITTVAGGGNYSTPTVLEIDCTTAAALTSIRPAVVYQGAGGLITVSADF
jgi:hypothetical protein